VNTIRDTPVQLAGVENFEADDATVSVDVEVHHSIDGRRIPRRSFLTPPAATSSAASAASGNLDAQMKWHEVPLHRCGDWCGSCSLSRGRTACPDHLKGGKEMAHTLGPAVGGSPSAAARRRHGPLSHGRADPLDGLRRYLTVIVDHESGRLIWAPSFALRLLAGLSGYLCSQPFNLLDKRDTVFLEKSQVLGERCRPLLTLREGEQRGRLV